MVLPGVLWLADRSVCTRALLCADQQRVLLFIGKRHLSGGEVISQYE